MQHNLSNIKPTPAEINHLWSTYIAESMAATMQKHMVATSEDPAFRNFLQSALDLSTQNIKLIKNIFNAIQHPIPVAFGEKDVNVNAPTLFDEAFSVRYTRLMTKYVLLNHSLAYSESSCFDFRELFSGLIDGSKKMIKKADEVLLDKGIFPKSPYILFPERVDYIDDKSYYGSTFR